MNWLWLHSFVLVLLTSQSSAWVTQRTPTLASVRRSNDLTHGKLGLHKKTCSMRGMNTHLLMSNGGDDGAGSIYTGTVKWFDTTKGFGFIVPDDGSSDIFVHQTAIQSEGFRSLADGEQVEFQVAMDKGRRKAINVTGPDGQNVKGAPFRPSSDYSSF